LFVPMRSLTFLWYFAYKHQKVTFKS
jgi:hypothetical protein